MSASNSTLASAESILEKLLVGEITKEQAKKMWTNEQNKATSRCLPQDEIPTTLTSLPEDEVGITCDRQSEKDNYRLVCTNNGWVFVKKHVVVPDEKVLYSYGPPCNR